MIAQAVPVPENSYKLLDERGITIGRIIAPRDPLDKAPPGDTVFLQRSEGPAARERPGTADQRRRPESNR